MCPKKDDKDVKLHSKPWITPEIVKLIKYGDRLKRKMIKGVLLTMTICTKGFGTELWLSSRQVG